jgi:hypothetical protein
LPVPRREYKSQLLSPNPANKGKSIIPSWPSSFTLSPLTTDLPFTWPVSHSFPSLSMLLSVVSANYLRFLLEFL